MKSFPVVAFGASTGGLAALRTVVAGLPADLPAAILVTLHIGNFASVLPEILSRSGLLPASHARDGELVVAGRIYVAPPDLHLMIEGEHLRLFRGPKENGSRPAIDPMFRSLALSKRNLALGVLLSGKLDDGVAGLAAIKKCGGIALVQDPADAEESDMPMNALDNVRVDYVLPSTGIAEAIVKITTEMSRTPALDAKDDARLIACEQKVHLQSNGMDALEEIGTKSAFSCPDCGGVLTQLDDDKPLRYRCHTGHAYTAGSLEHTQCDTVEVAMWAAIRALREHAALLEIASNRQSEEGATFSSTADGAAGVAANARADRLIALHNELSLLIGNSR